MTDPAAGPVSPDHELRGVLRVPAFRKLWTALSLSSFGDWLGLLALTALAPRLADGGYAAANIAIASVFILRLAPAILIGPLAGVVADRLDRRWTMVVCDLVRFALFLSIPLVGTLWWLLVATLLIEVASIVWIPAKEATIPNLVPRERLETANQLSLFSTYGTAPLAAAVFAGLALLSGMLDNAIPAIDEVDLALFFDALTFLVSALTIWRLKEIPSHGRRAPEDVPPSIWRTLLEGWKFVGSSRLVMGLVVGMVGASAAGGAVIGLARTFVTDLGGGDPGYGLLFGTVFCGLAAGMILGPRLVPDFSRRRLFGLAICGAGISLALLALIPNIVVAVLITFVIGGWAGVSWVTGYTLLGLEVTDELRGRTFALVQTLVRVVLVLVLAVAPLLAAAFGQHAIEVTDAMVLTYNGAAITMLLAGLLAAALGVVSYRQMDDRRGVPLLADATAAYRNEPVGPRGDELRDGFFIALEGGEGAGKSTQAALLGDWLRAKGHDVVVTFEPGATEVGRRLRSVLLDHPADAGGDGPAGPGGHGTTEPGRAAPEVSARTEALLFAADRAEHVASVIVPALRRGCVVITDRYVDSSAAYQGSGRDLVVSEVVRLSRWATEGLRPDLTIVLDLPAAVGLGRVVQPDRLESEPVDFHERVREGYLEIARRGGPHYLVLDATRAPDEVAAEAQARLEQLLPLSRREKEQQEQARQQEEERRRAEQQERTRREAEEAAERARREAEEAAERGRLAALAAAERAAREEQRQAAEAAERAAQEVERRRHAEEKAKQRAEAHEARARHRVEVHQEKERRHAESEAARARADAERARRALEDAERRRRHAEQVASGRHRAEPGFDDQPPPAAPSQDSDPPTRYLSLTDELFGAAEDDETIQLPRVRDRGDDR